MIDCHVHTKRCNHGKGDLEDFIISAIGRGIKILGFSEHAPLSIDPGMRLTIRGAQKYTMDIERLKKAYKNELKILCGFEVDYFKPVEKETLDFIRNINADFFSGAIHFLECSGKRVTIWDYPLFRDEKIRAEYFKAMGRAIDLGVFQSICHPDLLLRSGVNGGLALKSFEEVINQMKKANVCYEINCSGLSKSRYSQKSKKMISRGYLDRDLLLYGHSTGIKFTIGSDCHSPAELGKGVDDMLDFAAVHNLNINYFRDGERTEFLMKKSAPKVETKTS